MHTEPLDVFDPDDGVHHPPGSGGPPVTERFSVSVGGGGGVATFEAALVRKLTDLAGRGAHCVILERTRVECHYVQALVTSVGTHIESVGGAYLESAGHELTDDQVGQLLGLGWQPPDPDDEDASQNWWYELRPPTHHETAARWLLAALVLVHGLAEDEPVAVEIFPADGQEWEWVHDPDLPGGGRIDRLDD